AAGLDGFRWRSTHPREPREEAMSEPNAVPRRAMIAAATVGAGAAALGGRPAAAQAGKTFVLVHGAWHGGWCWRRGAHLLEMKSHKVFTPPLTRGGERPHLMSRGLKPRPPTPHLVYPPTTDLVTVVKWEDLHGICLVVLSSGGWPGSGAIEQVLDRVTSIVWLDAFKPENGQRGFDFASDFSRKALTAAVERGEPGRP